MKILIDTDWFSAIQDLQPSKQKEVLMAILNYPNGDSDTNLWKKTILPNLEKGKIAYFNKLQNLKQNNPQKINKKITDSVSESGIGSVSESTTDTTIREDKIKENNNILNNISEIKNNRFINEFTLFKAGFQSWVFPPEIRKVAMRHWSADEVRNIEKDFSCHEYETETSINDLLQTYPPKPKKKSYGEFQKVKLTDEEYEKLKEHYGDSLDIAIGLLDDYLASHNKKYTSHYAVMKKGGWVDTETKKKTMNDITFRGI